LLNIENFSKTYKGGKRAVDGLNLHIAPGEICAFIGHNGAGKTTTIRAVAGVLDFEEGEIYVDGHSVKREPIECKRRMAYIPDTPELYDNLTGIQFINFVADVYGVPQKERKALIVKYADALEITKNLGDIISSYSHGMKQKLTLVAALTHAPRLLVLDEPFVGLDPKAAHTLKQFMAQLCSEGSAIFFSTHVLETAEKLCDRVAIIKQGRLIAFGAMDEVRGDHSLESVFLELTDNG